MSERKLAHIEIIEELREIPGADKIEVAKVLGWECVVKKGEFKVGDKVIYVEVDSVMPDRPEYEFLRDRKFRIRTIKLRGVVSQGLVLPVTVLKGNNKYWAEPGIGFFGDVGDDVTEALGITKYLSPSERDEISQQERKLANEKNKLKKFMMRYSWFRKLFLSKKQKSGFPYWVSKTDEERIQNIPYVLEQFKDKEVYVTEKIDCLDENTLILTPQGLQTIKEICESDNKTSVLSQDIETGQVSFKPILNKIIKPNENKQWIKITLEDDAELLVTNDHRVWLPDLQCYRQVKDLTEKDFLLKLC